MISDKYRCVYVHIPKTAGTSIEGALEWIPPESIGPYQTIPRGSQDHRVIGELRRAMPADRFASYFKFTFVRNPWARVASWYKNVLSDPVHRTNFGIPESCSLTEFLEKHGSTWGLQTQFYWIREADGSIPLDFIGKFENLQADFEVVKSRIGHPELQLPHLTRSRDQTHYKQLYDATSQRVVAERYAEEIEAFGYSFGD